MSNNLECNSQTTFGLLLHKTLIHTCAVLEIEDKQQLEIPVLLTYDVFYITVHRHTTIVNSGVM